MTNPQTMPLAKYRVESGIMRLRVYRFIKSFKMAHDGCAPSNQEVAKALSLGKTTVLYHIDRLIELGLISRFGSGVARNIMVIGGYRDDPNDPERIRIVRDYEKIIEESEFR